MTCCWVQLALAVNCRNRRSRHDAKRQLGSKSSWYGRVTLKGMSDKDWVLNGIQMEMCTGVSLIGCLMLFLAGGHWWPSQHVNHSKSSFWSVLPVASAVCKTQSYLTSGSLTLMNKNGGCKSPGKIPFPPVLCLEEEVIIINQSTRRVLLYVPPFCGECWIFLLVMQVPRIFNEENPLLQIFISFNFQISFWFALFSTRPRLSEDSNNWSALL